MDEKEKPEEGFSFVFDWSANSKTLSKGTTLEYIPPVYNGCDAVPLSALVLLLKLLLSGVACNTSKIPSSRLGLIGDTVAMWRCR